MPADTDGVDQLTYVQLLSLSDDVQRTLAPESARTMWYFPEFRASAKPGNSFQLQPILNMLGLRYIVCHESVSIPDPVFQGGGDKVYVNNDALPRVWIPQHHERLPSIDAILQSMRDWSFDPVQRAFTAKSAANISDGGRGSVELVSDNPQFMSLTATIETADLVVIGDRFDDGWKVTVDSAAAELLCVHHVLRGVALSQGSHAIELRYILAAFVLGGRLFLAATMMLVAMLVLSCHDWFLRLRTRK